MIPPVFVCESVPERMQIFFHFRAAMRTYQRANKSLIAVFIDRKYFSGFHFPPAIPAPVRVFGVKVITCFKLIRRNIVAPSNGAANAHIPPGT